MVETSWASSGLEVLRTDDFPEGRLARPGSYVVCFGALWCPVTRRFVPRFAAKKGAVAGTLAIADITDNGDPLWDRFRIRITPSIVVFRDGVVAGRLDGRRFVGITSSAWSQLLETLAATPRPAPS
jgi:hypothetical protein